MIASQAIFNVLLEAVVLGIIFRCVQRAQRAGPVLWVGGGWVWVFVFQVLSAWRAERPQGAMGMA